MSNLNFTESIATQYRIPVTQVQQKYNEFLNKMRDVVSKKYPNNTNEKLDEYFIKNVSNLFQMSPYDRVVQAAESGEGNTKKIQCIIFGVKPSEDRFSVDKRIKKNSYYEDAHKAIADLKVIEQTSPDGIKYPVPIDGNEYKKNFNGDFILGEDGKPIKNNNYMQELPTFFINKLLMLVDNQVMYGTIPAGKDITEHSPRVGYKSNVYGSIFQGKYVTISRDGYDDLGRFEGNAEFPNGVYDVAKKFLEPLPEFKALEEVEKFDKEDMYKMRVVKGNLITFGDGEFSSYLILNDMTVPNGIKFSSSYQPIREDIKRIPKGTECYVIFDRRRFKPKDKDEVIEFNKLWGVIPSKNEDALQDEIARLLG